MRLISRTNGKAALAGLTFVGLVCALAMLTITSRAEQRVSETESADGKRWQAVAPGRIEPRSGEIKIGAAVAALISRMLVNAGDGVFAGEALIELDDREAQARLAAAEAQVALRKQARNDQSPSSRASERRRAEDALADAERAVVDAQSAVDRAAAEKRAGRGSDSEIEAARAALARAHDQLRQRRADLRKSAADAPLPTQAEGQLNVARADLQAAQAAVDKLTLRAPIGGTVLQVNGKSGEQASSSVNQPLVVLGDISGLRVRAELDERDFGEIKVGQAAVVRPNAFRGRDFAGTVSFIAPYVEPARANLRRQGNQTDVDVVEVLIDLAEPGPLASGMKADVYFRRESGASQ
jgi:HlyD family secretion protein